MSYSDWTDRVVAASFAGDVRMTSFDSKYHMPSTHDDKNYLPNSDRHKVCKYMSICCDLVLYSLSLSLSLSLSFSLCVTVTLSH